MRPPHAAGPAQRPDLDCDRYDCHPTVDKGIVEWLRTLKNNGRGADTVTRKDNLKTYIVVDCADRLIRLRVNRDIDIRLRSLRSLGADRRSRNLNSRDTRLQTL